MACSKTHEYFSEQQGNEYDINAELRKLPLSLVQFSTALRHLYNTYQVTGMDDATKTVLEVRDNTRRNALVYTEKILPVTEQVIRSVGMLIVY